MNTDSPEPLTVHHEQPASAIAGWFFLFITFSLGVLGVLLLAFGARTGAPIETLIMVFAGIGCGLGAFVTLMGFFTLQPNEAVVFMLFGAYRGTSRQNG